MEARFDDRILMHTSETTLCYLFWNDQNFFKRQNCVCFRGHFKINDYGTLIYARYVNNGWFTQGRVDGFASCSNLRILRYDFESQEEMDFFRDFVQQMFVELDERNEEFFKKNRKENSTYTRIVTTNIEKFIREKKEQLGEGK